MDIAIISGKGGTGKTMLAVAIATFLGEQGTPVCLMDCDVEEPNANIFLKAPVLSQEIARVPLPSVNQELCTGCGACERICRFNAIPVIKGSPLVLPELCHGCGGCSLICPEGAITETMREIGTIEEGDKGTIHYVGGRLNVGEAMSPPLIREVKRQYYRSGTRIIDGPPGASCPAVTAADRAHFAVLAAEPTPFGLNDFIIASEMLRALDVPFGAVINRDGTGGPELDEYCVGRGIEIIARIPYSWDIASAYSKGEIAEYLMASHRETIEKITEAALHGALRRI